MINKQPIPSEFTSWPDKLQPLLIPLENTSHPGITPWRAHSKWQKSPFVGHIGQGWISYIPIQFQLHSNYIPITFQSHSNYIPITFLITFQLHS